MRKGKILILSFSNLIHDARVSRQIAFLKSQFDVTAACYEGKNESDYRLIKLKKLALTPFTKIKLGLYLLAGLNKQAYSTLYGNRDFSESIERDFDLIVANDIETLPLAFKIKGDAKIIFDAHEYAPRHFEDKLSWRIFFQRFNKALCKKYIPNVDAMMTINHGLADEYFKNYGVKATIITNANYYQKISPSPTAENKIRLVHHGAANPSRKLELMIEMMNYLDDRFTLDLYLLTPATANKKTQNYLGHLKSLITNTNRIKIHPAVKSEEVISVINQYDIGVCFVPHVNFNYAHGLPNKLFDFVQARLGIAIGPTDEMTKLVNSFKLGIVSEDFDPKKLAKELNRLKLENVVAFKRQSDIAANELSAEKNRDIFLNLVTKFLN